MSFRRQIFTCAWILTYTICYFWRLFVTGKMSFLWHSCIPAICWWNCTARNLSALRPGLGLGLGMLKCNVGIFLTFTHFLLVWYIQLPMWGFGRVVLIAGPLLRVLTTGGEKKKHFSGFSWLQLCWSLFSTDSCNHSSETIRLKIRW